MEKVAYIELSNCIAKLLIVETKTNTMFNTICRKIVPITLGQDVDKDRFLKRANIDDTIVILQQFRKHCDINSVEKIKCITTFLDCDKPKNLVSFFDEVYTKCGLKFEQIDNSEQKSCIYTSVINSIDSAKGLVFQMEMDSIRVIQYGRRSILNYIFFDFGPLSLTNTFNEKQYSMDERQKEIESFVDNQFKKIEFGVNLEEIPMMGIGRQVEDLAKMVKKYTKYPIDKLHNYVVESKNIDYIEKQLAELGLDTNKKLKDMEEGRVDIFAVAVMIIRKLMAVFGKTEFTICKNGILEGKIISGLLVPIVGDKNAFDMTGLSMKALTSNYTEQQIRHAKHVEELSSMLYRELRVAHKLNRSYLRILKIAAFLHDVGYKVGYFNHSAHSYYIIMNNDIYGLTHREQILTAFISGMHHGEEIDVAEWMKYSSLLNDEDVEAVKKLGNMLQLAECFDLSMTEVIKEIYCDILGDSVIVRTISEVDKDYEIEEARKVIKTFNKYYKKHLDIL